MRLLLEKRWYAIKVEKQIYVTLKFSDIRVITITSRIVAPKMKAMFYISEDLDFIHNYKYK